ncbi:gamma-glutamyltransferase [Oscillatoria sp. FACHB-1407]|uniref:gamma-glutamyltransferase n=1 Tax=Oscillatoria sp. FACHB-1407 TaxID=2692847 RepID=UPI0016890FFF|nr:gamma-glutamyltransferase [Oscillatoria sp. FACHB-1407]MBD2462871.1 gamma-glutamyltransferase [Oscillatoria sp. FACHB-1407]
MGITSTRGGAIAAGHPNVAEAGRAILQAGGNAFDAIVAAVLTSCVAEPTLTSIAGGGFLLAHTQDNRNILFDFFTQTPRQKRDIQSVDFYPVDVNFGSVTQEFHVGLGSMAVPGNLAGLFHVHQKLGRLPFSTVVEPAIHYAKTGVEMGEFQAYCFQILSPIWLANPEARQVAAPQGTLLQPGETLFMTELANTLAYLAEEGARPFYEGEIAQQFVKNCRDRGGYITLDDLKHYRVIEREPLMMHYRGNTFVTNPPPSSGGTLIAFALKLLSQVDLTQMSFGSTEHLTLLARVMQLTNAARKDGYDSRLYEPNVAERFLATEHLARYAQELLQTEGVGLENPTTLNKWGSTTHVSVVDNEGNAASATTSNGEGSAYVIPGTGVMVNNMLGEADLHPNGFHAWQENVRISSMMAPTMVLRQNKPEIVLGSGGSNRIRTAILQVISNIIDFGMSVETAVNSPRVHWEEGVFSVEPGFENLQIDRTQFPFDDQVVLWEQQNMFFGGVHTVFEDAAGCISGAGDRRRNGAVATC